VIHLRAYVCALGGPKLPPAPSPPPPPALPPQLPPEATAAAAGASQAGSMAARGMAGTILTSPEGLTGTANKQYPQKTLLGS